MSRHGIESAHPYGLGYCKSRHQPYLTLPVGGSGSTPTVKEGTDASISLIFDIDACRLNIPIIPQVNSTPMSRPWRI